MDILLIIAAPTLIGLYVLWKILRGRVPNETVEVLRSNIYFCPHCERTFTDIHAARRCACRERTSPFSPGLARDIERTRRMGEVLNETFRARMSREELNQAMLEAHVIPPSVDVEGVDDLSREVLHHYSNRNGVRVMDGTVTIRENPQVIVVEGPISQPMLEAIREKFVVKDEPELVCTVDNRRLELS